MAPFFWRRRQPARSFIYIPFLAQDAYVTSSQTPSAKFQNQLSGDPYMRGAVKRLQDDNEATLLDCGRALQWLNTDDAKKAFKMLGTPADNMLANDLDVKPGPLPQLLFREVVQANLSYPFTCYTDTIIGLPKARSAGNEKLTGLASQDRLYIVGHGNPRGGGIAYKTNATGVCGNPICSLTQSNHKKMWIVDPTTLANLLAEDGLPKNHVAIDCVMCFSAGIKDEYLQTVQPYARRLAEALRGLGYNKIRVAGAHGIVTGGMNVRSELAHEPEEGRYLIETTQESYAASLRWF